MQKQILHTLPAAPDATQHTVLRLTIGTVSALGMARYRRAMRDMAAWLHDEWGIETNGDEPIAPEHADIWDVAFRRCYMLAALKQVEVGTCAPEDDAPTEWKPSELPEEWQSERGFAEEMPGSLFDQWDTAAQACNPDVFILRLDEKKRRPGSTIVI